MTEKRRERYTLLQICNKEGKPENHAARKESQRTDCIGQGTMEQSMESIINDEIKLSSLVRQQDTYQNSINTNRGRQEKGINQSIKTILYQKHEVCPRLVSVSRLNYFSVPAQLSLLSSVLLFVILIQESSIAKLCCNFSFIPFVRHCAILLLLQRGKRPIFRLIKKFDLIFRVQFTV